MRSPGFEPGSSTWQAEVLNQTRLLPVFGKLCAVAMMIRFEVYLFFLNSKSASVSCFFWEDSLRSFSNCELEKAHKVKRTLHSCFYGNGRYE